jgi:conjugal transfer ATP-binding protein TraC
MGKTMTVDHVAEALMREDDQRIRDVGEQLHPFTSEGEYGTYFNGPNTMKFSNNFMVLELEELKGRRHLQQVVLLLLIYQIQQDMYLGARDKHKVVIIDEAWDLLSEGDVAKFIETGYRRFRKYGGSAITITQSVTDLYDKPSGRAIAENSANMYLLQQKSEAIEIAKKDNRLPLSQGGYDLLKTVHTVRGAYSEILFITKMGAGIGRLVVDPFHQLLYSTKAEEVEEINRRVAAGMSTAEAINSMLEERHAA